MRTTHHPNNKKQKSTPPHARPTAKMPTRPARQNRDEKEPTRNWAYAEANASDGTSEGQKTSAPESIGRVYGGENNVTLPANEKAARDAKKRTRPVRH
jgi:hypothetical protein